MLATVVFPVPGGPKKIIFEILPDSIILLITPREEIKCSCPAISSKEEGRSLSARGVLFIKPPYKII
jgi:hypothetical protein